VARRSLERGPDHQLSNWDAMPATPRTALPREHRVQPGPAAVRTPPRRGPLRHLRHRLRRLLWLLAGGLVAAVLLGLAFLAWLPDAGDASARVDQILAEHGGRRVEVPPTARVARAVVAVEDHRFYTHGGIDFRSVARVGIAVVRLGGHDEGGSTISVQLAKQLYTGDRPDAWGKLQQAGIAVKLDRRWTKAEQLDMYLNAIYYGDGRYGIASAARGYFGDSALRLDWGEASLLAGLPQAPSVYDPTRNFRAAARRQGHVLNRMVATGVITRREAGAAAASIRRRAPGLGFRTRG
jgi:membrane peptidoglycan carboxypeptidase